MLSFKLPATTAASYLFWWRHTHEGMNIFAKASASTGYAAIWLLMSYRVSITRNLLRTQPMLKCHATAMIHCFLRMHLCRISYINSANYCRLIDWFQLHSRATEAPSRRRDFGANGSQKPRPQARQPLSAVMRLLLILSSALESPYFTLRASGQHFIAAMRWAHSS